MQQLMNIKAIWKGYTLVRQSKLDLKLLWRLGSGLAMLVLVLLVGTLLHEPKVRAIGQASGQYPDTGGTTYMDVELCPKDTSKCMQGRSSYAEIYVPVAMLNQTVDFTIIDGCDGTAVDGSGLPKNNSFSYTAFTNFAVQGSGISILTSKDKGGNSTCPKDIPFSFTAFDTTKTSDGTSYIYYFQADAISPKDGNSYYRNFFRLSASSPILFGLTNSLFICKISTYPYSCPSPDTLLDPGVSQSHSYSSFGQPGSGTYSQTIQLRTACGTSYSGSIYLYDLDAGNYSQSDIRARLIEENPDGSGATYIPDSSGWSLNGYPNTGNNVLFASPSFNFKSDKIYVFDIWNLSQLNTLQMYSDLHQVGPQETCGPSESAPTGSITATCALSGGAPLITFSTSTSDLDGDAVTISSGKIGSHDFSATSGTISAGFSETGTPSMHIDDGKGNGLDVSGSSYTCPANSPPSGTLSAVCNRLDAGGFPILDITVTTSDPEGQAVSVSGTAGGRAFSGSTSFDPVGQSESGSASMTLTDSAGGTTPVGPVNYTCPANRPPAPTITASCSLIGNPNVARISFTVGNISDPDGGGTPIYDVRIVMTSGSVSGSAANISNTSTGSYNVNRPATGTVQVEMRDNQTHVYTAWLASSPAFSCPQPPPTVNCTINGTSSFELGESYTPTVKVDLTAPAGSAPLTNTTAKTDVPGAAPATQTPPSQTVTLGVTGIFNYAPYVIPVTGSFPAASHVTWTAITPDDPAFVDCPSVTVNVVTKPYFKVVNGDIVSNNTVKGWNKALTTYTGPGSVNDSSGKSGAGVQGIIVATSIVNGVMSGDMFTPSTSLKTLTFANTSSILASPANAVYGGGFGAMSFTMPIADPNAAIWIPATTTSGVKSSYRYTGSTTFSNNSVAASTRMTVDLTGDLTINGNIIYSNSGGYGSVDAIPHIKFIVRKNGAVGGNIYINPNVSRIDAEFIAENSIDTCNTGSANKNDSCGPTSTTLVVNGSLASPTLQLNRLIGTVRLSTPGDAILTGPGTYANSGNIGEIFQFTPDMFLSTPAEPPTTGIGNRYDAVTALPPLF
jgi:hypothetical protein